MKHAVAGDYQEEIRGNVVFNSSFTFSARSHRIPRTARRPFVSGTSNCNEIWNSVSVI